MSSFGVRRNPSLHLMAGRLDLRDYRGKNYFKSSEQADDFEEDQGVMHAIACQAHRLRVNGGEFQQHRMILDKRRSLDRALLYSYQACNIKRVFSIQEDKERKQEIDTKFNYIPKVSRALINPDKLKMDYDDKILSVPFEYGYKPGDVFEWLGTGTFWLIRLQELNEVAYFRGDIRKCSYQISWEDEDGIHSSYVAVRGPVETKINYIQKHQISVDTPNHSLNIYMPRTEAALKYFRRYSKFYLQGTDEGSPQVCWRVEATDWVSSPGILEITAVEYYINETEDDLDQGLVGVLKTEPINPNDDSVEDLIEGEIFIKPRAQFNYRYKGILNAKWKIDDKKYPIIWRVNPDDPAEIALMWDSSYHGQFEISYGSITKQIVVESLF
jgi:hypothetical protein